MSHTDAQDNWPPSAEDLWLVHGTMGAPIGGMGPEGVGRFVLLRVAATRNHDMGEDDRTYVLGLEELTSILSGLITMGNTAFGRDVLVDAMGDALGMTPEDRQAAARAAAQRLRDDAREPTWLREDPDGFRIVDRD